MGVYISLLASNKVDPVQWEKKGIIKRIGPDKGGHWEVK